MTRSEDNWRMIKELTQKRDNVRGITENFTYEIIRQTSVLMDISRSLAIIADKLAPNEVKEEGEKNV